MSQIAELVRSILSAITVAENVASYTATPGTQTEPLNHTLSEPRLMPSADINAGMISRRDIRMNEKLEEILKSERLSFGDITFLNQALALETLFLFPPLSITNSVIIQEY